MTFQEHYHERQAKPAWLKRRLPSGPQYEHVRSLLKKGRLHTVCQEARCPNMWECFSNQVSTFMILGSVCTRNCRFCNVTPGSPLPPDPDEPRRVAEAVKELNLNYVVITSVTRDDLNDGGAAQFARTLEAVHSIRPGQIRAEVLVPDFLGDTKALATVMSAGPAVFNHNIETVPRLYSQVRPGADFQRSLAILRHASENFPDIPVKSGIMVGLGETQTELIETFQTLRKSGCSLLTIGQYLQPSKSHLSVKTYYRPESFEKLEVEALRMGFAAVAAGPFVRSSYQAQRLCSGL